MDIFTRNSRAGQQDNRKKADGDDENYGKLILSMRFVFNHILNLGLGENVEMTLSIL